MGSGRQGSGAASLRSLLEEQDNMKRGPKREQGVAHAKLSTLDARLRPKTTGWQDDCFYRGSAAIPPQDPVKHPARKRGPGGVLPTGS